MPIKIKISLLTGVFFLSLAFASADSALNRYSISASAFTGFLHGQAEEIVYQRYHREQYLSQLLWDIKPLMYLGMGGEFGPRRPFEDKGIIGALSLKFGLPFKTGIVEDRDWLNSFEEWMTHFSQHNAYSQSAFHLDMSAGYSWCFNETFILRAYGEFSFMNYSWSGEDGYLQYPRDSGGDYIYDDAPEWKNNLEKDNVSGMILFYTQNWFIITPGVSYKARLSPLLRLEGHLNITPLVFCIARDDHLFSENSRYIQGATFWDYLSLGTYISVGNKVSYLFNEYLDLSLSASYRLMRGLRGRTYRQNSGMGDNQIYMTSVDSGGAGYSAIDIQFSARLRIHDWNIIKPLPPPPPPPLFGF